MERKLLVYCSGARSKLIAAVVLGVLGVGATIAQMALLSHIVGQVLLAHTSMEQLLPPLLFLLAVIVLRAGLAGGRELAVRHSAITVRSTMRRRLFAHILHLGPSFCRGEPRCHVSSACPSAHPGLQPPGTAGAGAVLA